MNSMISTHIATYNFEFIVPPWPFEDISSKIWWQIPKVLESSNEKQIITQESFVVKKPYIYARIAIGIFFTHLLFAYYKLDSDTLESAKAPSNQIWFALG